MRRRILIILAFVVLVLCSCSGANKKTTAPDDIPDDLVAILPSGDEIYIYMTRDNAEKLINSQGTQDSLGRVNYEELDLRVGYIDNQLVDIELGRNSKIKLKSGISANTKFDELDSDFENLDGERAQHGIKRFTHNNGAFTRNYENAIHEAQPFDIVYIDVYFFDERISLISVYDLYAGKTAMFDK